MTARRALGAVVVLLVAGAGVPAGGRTASCTPTGAQAHRDLRYAASPGTTTRLQSLDLYTPVRPPRCGRAPVVVWVHGGAFVSGDKANGVARKVDLFTRQGWAVASVNYRLVGRPGSGPTAGRYPAAEEDVASAVAFLHRGRTAARYRLDRHRVVLLGHSAGAFLVSLDSTDGRFLEGAGMSLDDIACTASLDTTYDIPTQIAAGGGSERMFRNAFGDDPAVWEAGSPMRNVAPGTGIPHFLVVTRGLPPRVAQSEAFVGRLRQAGVPAGIVHATGLTHAQVNTSVGAPGDVVVTPPLLDFFRACLRR